ncbi:carbohydrate ABC transporter permease [Changpingibacter yushuensis]|uniref:carbohydrate ABC transporter permease n=1 Tax=Changpingibacter yushuensis TaxID=2758440 RepID=UPI0015F5F53F|nr:sugar ABC transporter permease [Changpingibacter yushuensis]
MVRKSPSGTEGQGLRERLAPPRRVPNAVKEHEDVRASRGHQGIVKGPSRSEVLGNRLGWTFVSPTLLIIALLFIAPIVLVFVMAATKWTLMGGQQDVNFPENFHKVFADPLLMDSAWFTLKYTFATTFIIMPIALGLAMLVQESRRWNNIIRTAILLPSALGIASSSLLFYALYSPQVGPLNSILAKLGLMEQNASLLGSPNGALWATVFLVVWRFSGYYMLLTMVGLQAIPPDVYEAAKIDGANRFQSFMNITLPLLKPTLAMTWIMSITGSLLAFDQFYVLTKGGPNNSTVTVVQLIYKYAFETKKDLGMAAALSVIVLVALVVINFFMLKSMGVNDEED